MKKTAILILLFLAACGDNLRPPKHPAPRANPAPAGELAPAPAR